MKTYIFQATDRTVAICQEGREGIIYLDRQKGEVTEFIASILKAMDENDFNE